MIIILSFKNREDTMKDLPKSLMVFWLLFLFLLTPLALTQEKAIKADLPVLVTSCGQSPGPVKLKVFMKRLKIDHVYNVMATADDLIAAKKEGKPFKSLIIVTGASLKGMGAAGISLEDELDRTKALIAEAKKQGIMVIGSHIEGMERRSQGAAAGDNSDELSIDTVCPESALLLIRKDGDEDGRFTAISEDKNIPMLVFVKNMEIPVVLKSLYEK